MTKEVKNCQTVNNSNCKSTSGGTKSALLESFPTLKDFFEDAEKNDSLLECDIQELGEAINFLAYEISTFSLPGYSEENDRLRAEYSSLMNLLAHIRKQFQNLLKEYLEN